MNIKNLIWVFLFIPFIISCNNKTADDKQEANNNLKDIKSQTNTYPPPGKLVDIGGYKLHIIVDGEKSQGPTVVFFHGAGDIALFWNLVLPKVGKFAKAIAIDQNGEGWSDHGYGMALNQQVYDSHEVLLKGGFDPPYIIVGHSLGGIIANLFAAKYKDEVDGVVLVDATHPDIVLKIYNKETKTLEWKKMRLTADEPIPQIKTEISVEPGEISSYQIKKNFGDKLNKFSERDQKLFNWIYNERPWTYIKGQEDTYEAEIFDEMYKNPKDYHLGETPLIVLTGGAKKLKKGDENWSSEELMNHSILLQKDLLTLSSRSEQIIAKNSGHHIHIDEPEVVVSAIKKLIDQITDVNKK